MSVYKHGTYGEFVASIGLAATQSGTIPVYVGVAPVNLIRGFAKYVNTPIKLADFEAVKNLMGYSANWSTFDLCEAFKLHFDNEAGNVGPIVAINVLDPATHKKGEAVTVSLTFVNGRASIESDTIILDTLVLAEKVEGTDFSVSYDFAKGLAIIDSLGDVAITGNVDATYYEVDTSAIDAETIIGGVTDAGVYTGLGCIELMYQELGMTPNLLMCPKWSSDKTVYNAMLSAASKVNGHWDACVYADIPVLVGGQKVDTIAACKTWKETNAYTNELSKVFWPMGKDNAGNVYHAAVLAAWVTMQVDQTHDGVPMESPSNKVVPVVAQYFGEGSTNRGFDTQRANELNADGITTIVYWGGRWVLWGPHTAAYKHGVEGQDARAIFDVSIRMMMHVANSFHAEHALEIDGPMTRALADTIKQREQEKLDAWAAMGAFIGEPVCDFKESSNSAADMIEGNFVWGTRGTPTPPFKSGTLRVAYTAAGFDSYFGEV